MFVAHCPERVLPGRILLEVVQNDRVVGGMTPACTQKARPSTNRLSTATCCRPAPSPPKLPSWWKTRTATSTSPLPTSCRSCLRPNGYRSLGDHRTGQSPSARQHPVARTGRGRALHQRRPLVPGPRRSPDHTADSHGAGGQRSQAAPCRRTRRPVGAQFASPKIGCLGLTYKADVDDLRESPSLEIVRECGSDRWARSWPAIRMSRRRGSASFPARTGRGAGAVPDLVLLTDHRQFRNIPRRMLQEKVVVDTRGMWR